MPIYAYRCEACGHQADVLQKISELPLSICPVCGASGLKKQVTAAGFQLKGSGWYVTDFRNKSNSSSSAKTSTSSEASPAEKSNESKAEVTTSSTTAPECANACASH